MKIGILADIHGNVENLEVALARLLEENVDKVILLGDIVESPRNAAKTVSLLNAHHAVGVWGNHELGLCIAPGPEILSSYTEPVAEFFSTLHSHFELDDLLFSHSFPSQDPTDPVAYYLGSRPGEGGAADASFASFDHRIIFIGHFHRWFVSTPDSCLSWDGSDPIEFARDQRYLIVVHAVLYGWFAIYDDSTNVLTPLQCRPSSGLEPAS